MNAVGFPKLFKGNTTRIVEGNEATLQNIHLLLGTEAGSMPDDPDFGITLRRYVFNQNSYILKDILIDEIYTKICMFIPQVFLERKNIVITQEKSKLYATITCKNKSDFTINTFNLNLFESEDNA